MKAIKLLAVALLAIVSLNAQEVVKLNVWVDGAKTEFTLSSVDSLTFSTSVVPDDVLSGAFSISATKQVCFSRGNLQYQASAKIWRFAENQYDYIGSDNSNISDTYTGWIDLFGWSCSTGSAKWGISTSLSKSDYSGDFFVDWGANTIGMDTPNAWRTLSKDEWYYLFYTRTNAPKLFGLGSVNGVNGIIILPDGWTAPAGITFTPSTEKGLVDKEGDSYHDSNFDVNNPHWPDNTYTLSDWQKMEDAGAVFLPAAGYRYGQNVLSVRVCGFYWSSMMYNNDSAYTLYFTGYSVNPQSSNLRYYGYSVRLVQDL